MIRKWSATSAVIIVSIILFPGCGSSPGGVQYLFDVDRHYVEQDYAYWCWAATTEMITKYYRGGDDYVPQCRSINYVHRNNSDAPIPVYCPPRSDWVSGDYNIDEYEADIEQLKRNWEHWGFDYSFRSSDRCWEQVKCTISKEDDCNGSPILAVWTWNEGKGHAVVVHGFREMPEGNFVLYYDPQLSPLDSDPLPPQGETILSSGEWHGIPYDEFVDDETTHRWTASFYNFEDLQGGGPASTESQR